MTDVTIRGIDDGIYRRFSAEARNRGMAIGKLVTLAMSNLLEVKTMGNYKVENIKKEVIVSKNDLESLEKPVIFKNINKLTFAEDVDWSTFRDYIEEIKNYQYGEALATIRENMPMPSVCGRVCPHPCETACRRKNVDDSINIMVLKRTASDYEWQHNITPPMQPKPSKNKKVAIVGAGLRCGNALSCRLPFLHQQRLRTEYRESELYTQDHFRQNGQMPCPYR
jgi:hypothetical protein